MLYFTSLFRTPAPRGARGSLSGMTFTQNLWDEYEATEYEATDNWGIVQYDYFDTQKHSSRFWGVVFAFDDCRTVSNGH